MWTLFRPRWDDPERVKAARRVLATSTPGQSPEAYQDIFDIGTIMLTPGNVLYVPLFSPRMVSDMKVESCHLGCSIWCIPRSRQ